MASIIDERFKDVERAIANLNKLAKEWQEMYNTERAARLALVKRLEKLEKCSQRQPKPSLRGLPY